MSEIAQVLYDDYLGPIVEKVNELESDHGLILRDSRQLSTPHTGYTIIANRNFANNPKNPSIEIRNKRLNVAEGVFWVQSVIERPSLIRVNDTRKSAPDKAFFDIHIQGEDGDESETIRSLTLSNPGSKVKAHWGLYDYLRPTESFSSERAADLSMLEHRLQDVVIPMAQRAIFLAESTVDKAQEVAALR